MHSYSKKVYNSNYFEILFLSLRSKQKHYVGRTIGDNNREIA